MIDIKALLVTGETSECGEIENILKQNIKEIKNKKLDNEALVAMNLFAFDIVLVYADADLILQKDFFVNKIANYTEHIPVIILISEDDSKHIKSISNLPGVDFCLSFDFNKDILIELLQDCIKTAIELRRKY